MRALAALTLAAAPAFAQTADAPLTPEENARIFDEACLASTAPEEAMETAEAALAPALFVPLDPGGFDLFQESSDGLATLGVAADETGSACEMGLSVGAADLGPALEEATRAAVLARAPDAEEQTLAAGTAWEWREGDLVFRTEYLQADDAFLLRHTISR